MTPFVLPDRPADPDVYNELIEAQLLDRQRARAGLAMLYQVAETRQLNEAWHAAGT